jgi:hypothetical protein
VPRRRLLVDNDAFIVLSGAGLLEKAVARLGFEMDAVFCLPALPFVLGRSRRIQQNYPPDVVTRARISCDNVAYLNEREHTEGVLDELTSVSGIDPGEAVIFAIAAEDPDSVLLTGDKVSLRALGTAARAHKTRTALSGRVICLEYVYRLLVEADGPTELADAFAILKPTNASLRIFFSEGNRSDHAACLLAIQKYYEDLSVEVGPGLLL